jgi:hypothetical protein
MSKADNTGPAWLIFAGVVIAAIGGILMGVSSSKKSKVLNVLDFDRALGNPGVHNAELASAISLAHFGLGVLISGGALALAGITVAAARK